MKQYWNKLRTRRGETVAEVLLAVLVAGVAMALVAGAASAAVRLNVTAREVDAAYYAQLSAAETRAGPKQEAKLTITLGVGASYDFDVDIYGGDGELRAYEKR